MGVSRCAKTLVFAAAWAALLAAAVAVAGDESAVGPSVPASAPVGTGRWLLRLPADGPVVYRGLASFDDAGMGSSSFLYPAPNLGGLLAAILAHGALVESAKKSEKDALQLKADKVLVPYQGVLDKFNYRNLMERALAKTSLAAGGILTDGAVDSGGDTRVEIAPSFSLTQDESAIVADSAILIVKPGATPETAYRTTIRVISSPLGGSNLAAYWTANNGERLKDASAELVAKSLDLAFADAAAGTDKDAAPYRTVRYRQGTAEKMERAQVMREDCGRLVIRNLRGALMSVPVSRGPTLLAGNGCATGVVRAN